MLSEDEIVRLIMAADAEVSAQARDPKELAAAVGDAMRWMRRGCEDAPEPFPREWRDWEKGFVMGAFFAQAYLRSRQ
jgi:hypothetical protein